MTDIHGINLAMQTPFDDSGGVDFAGLDRLLDQYLETGLHGFVLSACTGQHPYLTEDECNKIFAAALKRIDGKVPVICQTSALNL
jgi:4-hydroxy-tetrahydrodipicolinate synthase